MAKKITSSVGKGGTNYRPDVEVVQGLINNHITSLTPLRALVVDGRIGPNTIRAIEEFQQRIGKMRVPDGRVDPNGRTIKLLNDTGKAAPAPPPEPQSVVVPSAHSIRVVRKWATDLSTISEFTIDDARPSEGEIAHGFILERPGPDTLDSGLRLRIVEGTFELKWQTVTGLAGVRPHLPLPWLYNSSVREGRKIYIHNGNYPRNTDGCLLVGTSRAKDMVGSSVTALTRMKRYLERVGIDKVRLKISSSYE